MGRSGTDRYRSKTEERGLLLDLRGQSSILPKRSNPVETPIFGWCHPRPIPRGSKMLKETNIIYL